MKLRHAALLIGLLGFLTACGGVPAKPVPKTEEPIPATTKVSELMTVESPSKMSLAQITEGLRDYVNQEQGPVAPRLAALYDKWKLKPLRYGSLMLEADLDGDGAKEVALTYRDPSSVNGTGTLFVIYKKGDRYEVDRLQEETIAPAILQVTDLNQDGRPEVLWMVTSVGANTSISQIYATSWKPGSFERLAGKMETTNLARLEVQDHDVVIQGNSKGGYGAGTAQRERIDRYRWVDGGLRAVEKKFTPSEFAYHKLQDGLLAEEFGDPDAAGKAFAAATEPNRAVLPEGDSVTAEWRGKLSDAVHTYSQFRIALRMYGSNTPAEFINKVLNGGWGAYAGFTKAAAGAPTRDAACKAAIAWAEANPEFVKALNSPRGYANPQWKAADLCGPLPNF